MKLESQYRTFGWCRRLVAGGFAVFVACVAVSSATAQTRNGASLTLTRVSSLVYSAAPATVTINGRHAASLWQGSSTTVVITPGQNRVSVSAWSYPGEYAVIVNARPGGRYAIEISPRQKSLAPSMLFGVAGGLVDASVNKEKAGAFEMRVTR